MAEPEALHGDERYKSDFDSWKKIDVFMQSLCFKHQLAVNDELPGMGSDAWEYPVGEFKLLFGASDVVYRKYCEVKRRSDWFLQNKPEICHSADHPWRWSGHPGKEYAFHNGPADVQLELVTLANAEIADAIKVVKNPKTQWTKETSKKNEQLLHSTQERLLQRAAAITSLVTIIPRTPAIYSDAGDRIRNPEFGTLSQEWRKVPQDLQIIMDAFKKVPGLIAVGIVVEAHPRDTKKGKLKKAPKPKPAPHAGDGLDAINADPALLTKKRKAAARKKAAANVNWDELNLLSTEDKEREMRKIIARQQKAMAEMERQAAVGEKPSAPVGAIHVNVFQ